MEPNMPSMELWTVVRWMVLLLILFGLKEFSALIVKKWWFGVAKHDRRKDSEESRGWIERFLENQREHTDALISMAKINSEILNQLRQNGEVIEKAAEKMECKFENHRHF